jgi:hypothetical protein
MYDCVFVYMCLNVYISYKEVYIHILLSTRNIFIWKGQNLQQENTQAYVHISNNILGYFFLNSLQHFPCFQQIEFSHVEANITGV